MTFKKGIKAWNNGLTKNNNEIVEVAIINMMEE